MWYIHHDYKIYTNGVRIRPRYHATACPPAKVTKGLHVWKYDDVTSDGTRSNFVFDILYMETLYMVIYEETKWSLIRPKRNYNFCLFHAYIGDFAICFDALSYLFITYLRTNLLMVTRVHKFLFLYFMYRNYLDKGKITKGCLDGVEL